MQPAGPHPTIVEHPRFQATFQEALARHGLADYMGEPVKRLLTGEADPRTFQCCDTGCRPCMKDYLRAAEMVLTRLARPAGRKKFLGLF